MVCSKVDFLTFPIRESSVLLLRRKSEKDELMLHCMQQGRLSYFSDVGIIRITSPEKIGERRADDPLHWGGAAAKREGGRNVGSESEYKPGKGR